MDENVSLIEQSARVLEAVGICVILLGTLAATAVFLWRLWKRAEFADIYTDYRRGLGRAILLGLEFLVGADIIGTVAVKPTYENLGVLALIVLVRTFLSFSLEVEIEGRWPWNRASDPD
jgi:uncharacterized membrane protein